MDVVIKPRRLHEIKIFRQRTDAYGDREFAPPEELLAYQYGEVKAIVSMEGRQIVSRRIFIVDGLHEFEWGDELEWAGKRQPIQQFANFDGLIRSTGTTVIYQ